MGIMEELILESYLSENQAIEQYLSDSIIQYGLAQHKTETPEKVFCSCKNKQGILLGAAMGTKTLNLLFISHVYVEDSNRGKGIGSVLLASMEQKAKELGCSVVRLNTFNNSSHSFYLKNGYKETMRIDGYMNGFDLIYYDKHLN